jgi:choline dehydrogenase
VITYQSTLYHQLTPFTETVLVVEYGEVGYAPGAFDPPSTVWGGPTAKVGSWTFNSLPNPELNNKMALVFVGQAVGGSSAINGMFFDRGSRHDYDAWAQVGSPEFDSSTIKWNWDNLYPYFKKVMMHVWSIGMNA